MSKASEDALAALHGAVATALTGSLVERVGEDGVPVPPSASHIMAAITFLKNNNITADVSSNTELSDLNAALTARRAAAKQKLTKADLDRVADQLDKDLGGYTGALQ